MIDKARFVVGCTHSGTTLLSTMIGCHSNVYFPAFETRMFHINKKERNKLFTEKNK